MKRCPWLALVTHLAACACGAGTSPREDASVVAEDASHDAARDAARDADLEPKDAGDSGSDAGTCELPDASYYPDSGPENDDGGAPIYCFWGGIQCPADRRFCCEYEDFGKECRASAFDATSCHEHPQRYLEVSGSARCPCDLPWACGLTGIAICTDHALLGEYSQLDSENL